MSDDDLPYRAEYAKSGRASCKGCKIKIEKESLRMAAMVQSPFFDGKQPKWYHHLCFFGHQKPASVADIAHFDSLRFEDQKVIREKIQSSASGSGAAAAASTSGRVSKKAASSKNNDFQVEYAKSSAAKCQQCGEKILKSSVRVGKRVYDNERARTYGAYIGWHHLACFGAVRHELAFFDAGSSLPGFKSLAKADQTDVNSQLGKLKAPKREAEDVLDGAVGAKKARATVDKATAAAEAAAAAAYEQQCRTMFAYRDELNELPTSQLQQLLWLNHNEKPAGRENLLDLLCDLMTFGALDLCSVCNNNSLVFKSGVGYQCRGDLTSWSKCSHVELKPTRCQFVVPAPLAQQYPFLRLYKCKVGDRILGNLITQTDRPKEEKKPERVNGTPLQGLVFVLAAGVPAEAGDKIRRMGGKLLKRVSEQVTAVICTKEIFDLGEDKTVCAARKHDVHVIRPETVSILKSDTVFATIDSESLYSTSAKLNERLGATEQQLLDQRRHKSSASTSSAGLRSSVSRGRSMAAGGTRRMVVKNGSTVDPDSGLQERAHVYRCPRHDTPMTAVLCRADAAANKNSYYRLQVLAPDCADAGGPACWLFRAWGRVGTVVGGTKLQEFSEPAKAAREFCQLYRQKTDNDWEMVADGGTFKKMPGFFYPMDVDDSDNHKLQQLSASSSRSQLPAAIKQLVCTVFDISAMLAVMVDFEIDLDRLPLGKLSRQQLQQALLVLTEAQNILYHHQQTDVLVGDDATVMALLRDCSNRFFTLVPHCFGLNRVPVLDSLDVIKEKVEMVTSLLEIQLAYKLHSDVDSKQQEKDSAAGAAVAVDPVDRHYRQLKSDIEVLDPSSHEHQLLVAYVKNTHGKSHSHYTLSVTNIFRVSRHGELARYKPFSRLPNRKLLWHGSRITNFAGILSQGLRIAPPEAPSTGYMFGKGIYFADMVSKSANYCFATYSKPKGLLLLCEVALGNMYERKTAEFVEKLPPGKHSTKGVGQIFPQPSQSHYTDAKVEIPLGSPCESGPNNSSLIYNEYIVYDTAQCHIKYLLEVDFHFN